MEGEGGPVGGHGAMHATEASRSGPPAVESASVATWRPPRSRVDRSCEVAALACVRRGRRDEALAILMAAYGAALTAFAVRVLRDRELAKDVRQQVFLDAFQGLERFEGRCSVWSWLCSIAYHRCFDELRRVRRAGPVDEVGALDELVGPLDEAVDAERIAKRRALEQCLGKLPDAMRAQLLMRCFLGLSYAEIGEVVGASPGTVQVRISRILPSLRRCLRGEGIAR